MTIIQVCTASNFILKNSFSSIFIFRYPLRTFSCVPLNAFNGRRFSSSSKPSSSDALIFSSGSHVCTKAMMRMLIVSHCTTLIFMIFSDCLQFLCACLQRHAYSNQSPARPMPRFSISAVMVIAVVLVLVSRRGADLMFEIKP